MLQISEEVKEKAKKAFIKEHYPCYYDKNWIQDIEKECNRCKVSNDSELLLCLSQFLESDNIKYNRDGGNYMRFLKTLISITLKLST